MNVFKRFFMYSLCGCMAFSCLALSACGFQGQKSIAVEEPAVREEAATEESVGNASFAAKSGTYDLSYSDRELDSSYDAETAVAIYLENGASRADGLSGGDGVSVDGDEVTITKEGTYIVSGTLSNGQLAVEVADDAKVQVVFDGVDICNEDGPALFVKQTDKCFLTLAENSENILSDGDSYALEANEDEPNATLFSKSDLAINGTGSLEVVSSYRHAVNSKDDLVITGGSYVISSVEDALRGRDCVMVKGGSFELDAGEDAIVSSNAEDDGRGFICIDGGVFDVAAGDDAVHAEKLLVVNDGEMNVSDCVEGYEAQEIYVSGGRSHIIASDDGLNASSAESTEASTQGQQMPDGPGNMAEEMSEECLVSFSGGMTVVDAAGDGVDSNGYFEMSDGVLLVSGTEAEADVAFDYGASATISGGTVIACGPMGMSQSFTEGTQAFAFVQAQGSEGESVAVLDSAGSVLASFNPSAAYSTVLVSAPGMEDGGSYSLALGASVDGADEFGYVSGGNATGGSAVNFTASTEGGAMMGGMPNADGAPDMPPASGGPGAMG